ncbi:coiled-coil domain-containing protein 12 isoform X4 [Paroedura picta]|uniref:coiled-coil domain-containing protein 12 isoform X4 n=1 Tax=Paroedura picta TaxID=143630 RepID=UPI004055FBC1
MAAPPGGLQEEALRRKERLKALRERTGTAARQNKDDGPPEAKQFRGTAEEAEEPKHNDVNQIIKRKGLLSCRGHALPSPLLPPPPQRAQAAELRAGRRGAQGPGGPSGQAGLGGGQGEGPVRGRQASTHHRRSGPGEPRTQEARLESG